MRKTAVRVMAALLVLLMALTLLPIRSWALEYPYSPDKCLGTNIQPRIPR